MKMLPLLLVAVFIVPTVAALVPGDIAASGQGGHPALHAAVHTDAGAASVPFGMPARDAHDAHALGGAGSPDPLVQAGLAYGPEVGVHARPSPRTLVGDFAGDYNVRFVCPSIAGGDEVQTTAGCPSYILDPEDVMSQPSLVVDPRDANYIAFNALHGGPGVRSPVQQDLPSGHSRDNVIHQPHTTFISTDGGSFWHDYRYYAPDTLAGNYDEVFGEDNVMTRDHRGQFHVGSVYAVRQGEELEWVVALYALGRASDPPDYNTYIVRRAAAGHEIQDISMDFIRSGKTVFTTWLEAPPGGQGKVTVLHQDIDARTSTWRPQPAGHAIEGCTGISNSVAVAGDVWIGCFAGQDFDPEPYIVRDLEDGNATYTVPDWDEGQLQMFRIDGKEWTTHYVGPTPFNNAVNAVLGSAENVRKGAMFLAGGGAQGGRSIATVSFGIYGAQWTELQNYAPSITGAGLGEESAQRAVVDARVTAAGFTANSGAVHMIFLERYAQTDNTQGGASESEFYKTYAAVHYTGRNLGHVPLDVGRMPTYISPQRTGLSSDLYMDQHDGIVMHTTSRGLERIYVAYGDLGWVRFAEVVEDNPPPPGFLLTVAPQIIAAPLAAGNAALTAAAAGVLSLSVVTRMLAVKKKTTAEAPSL